MGGLALARSEFEGAEVGMVGQSDCGCGLARLDGGCGGLGLVG